MDRAKAGGMIRSARLKTGITQTELAERLNVSQGTVGAWEIGYTFPRPQTIPKLCEILNIPVDELIKAG